MVLNYLVKNGHKTVFMQCKSKISFLQRLKEFQFMDKDGTDQGVKGTWLNYFGHCYCDCNIIVVTAVRERAEKLVILVTDEDRVIQENLEAKVVRNYVYKLKTVVV